ncbi:ABC-three component system protein [Telluribacter sp.]|jgi:hypothetical protein|uniref:ABC-three component system protein n=1 Tax=Telluribacter sp. TaxID=1978767 RepID=UPI002E0E587C|nr:ABC-three component system protein [Telluribacter sp.]
MTIDQLQEYIVCVHTGSGCLFQPMTEEQCSYVLTAKHIFIEAGELTTKEILISRSRLGEGGPELHKISFGTLHKGVNYFPHPDKDIAILKIEKQDGLDYLIRADDVLTDRKGYFLSGYPYIRRNTSTPIPEWYRNNEDVVIKEQKGEFREARVEGAPNHEEIKGQSGGGILKIKGKYLLLAGVQNRMVPGNEQLGNILFSPLCSFDEIILLYSSELTTLCAPYMRCFSYLKDYVFNLQAGLYTDDVAYAIEYLKTRTVQIVQSKTTPYFIKEFFNIKLLINQQPQEVLQTRNIWIAWLEFLIILNIAKEKVHSSEELEEVFNSFRMLFSNTEGDWSGELQNILYSDFRGLRENGLVVIGTPNPPHNDGYELPYGIPLITQVKRQTDRSKLKIDDGISYPFDKFRFVHLDYFKNKTISKKYLEYRDINNDIELLAKLKNEYEQLFKTD